jgi:hypothetical protein
MAWAFESTAIKYPAKDIVQENKISLWSYKGHQGLSY